MKKVLVFGTFDILHPGHQYFLQEAKKNGGYLIVVVARDKTVLKVKGESPLNGEKIRVKNLNQLDIATEVVLGSAGTDKHKIIDLINPDIIALGYDQKSFTHDLESKYGKRIKIIRIRSFKPQIYKSSKLRNKLMGKKSVQS